MVVESKEVQIPDVTTVPDVQPATRSVAGLFVKREQWALTMRGKLVVFAIVSIVLLGVARGSYPFLAVTQRVAGDVLVVDGWLPAYTLEQVIKEVNERPDRQILVVKGLYQGDKYASGELLVNYTADYLVRSGAAEGRVHKVFFKASDTDRTFRAALAVREWLAQHAPTTKSLDLVTLGPHARRSRVLYTKAFGDSARIGIISVQDPTYDPVHWWRSSPGIREVPFECLAYVYVRLFFYAPVI